MVRTEKHKHMVEQSELRTQSLSEGETLARNSVFLIELAVEQVELLAALHEAQIEMNLKLAGIKEKSSGKETYDGRT